MKLRFQLESNVMIFFPTSYVSVKKSTMEPTFSFMKPIQVHPKCFALMNFFLSEWLLVRFIPFSNYF